MALEQESFDGKSRARVGHGDHAVLLMLERTAAGSPFMEAAVVLTPEGARKLARMLHAQARYSEKVLPPDEG